MIDPDPSAPSFVVVGRGRMGAALAAALARTSARCTAVTGREAALPSPGGPAVWVLAVRDAGLAELAARIAPSFGPHDVALHLAGMRGPDALSLHGIPALRAGSLHPLVARSSPRGDEPFARGAAFLFEGGALAETASRALCALLDADLVCASSVDRARYHAGAALVATGAVALAQGATEAFHAALSPAPDDHEVRTMVASLLRSVADNVLADGATRALASPLVRGDTDAVARHLRSFATQPTARALYRAALAQVLTALDAPEALKTRADAVLQEDAEAQQQALTPAPPPAPPRRL